LYFFSFLNKKQVEYFSSVFLQFLDFSWICGRVVSYCACRFSSHYAMPHPFMSLNLLLKTPPCPTIGT